MSGSRAAAVSVLPGEARELQARKLRAAEALLRAIRRQAVEPNIRGAIEAYFKATT